MRITFTDDEIEEILESLEDHFCTDSEDAIAKYQMIVKKFKRAISTSKASKRHHKRISMEMAKFRKEGEIILESNARVLHAYRESKKE